MNIQSFLMMCRDMQTLVRMLSITAVICLTGCATQKTDENTVSLAKIKLQEYQPITRLAFVESASARGHIAVVRNDPRFVNVSDIETAAGNPDEKIVDH